MCGPRSLLSFFLSSPVLFALLVADLALLNNNNKQNDAALLLATVAFFTLLFPAGVCFDLNLKADWLEDGNVQGCRAALT